MMKIIYRTYSNVDFTNWESIFTWNKLIKIHLCKKMCLCRRKCACTWERCELTVYSVQYIYECVSRKKCVAAPLSEWEFTLGSLKMYLPHSLLFTVRALHSFTPSLPQRHQHIEACCVLMLTHFPLLTVFKWVPFLPFFPSWCFNC